MRSDDESKRMRDAPSSVGGKGRDGDYSVLTSGRGGGVMVVEGKRESSSQIYSA